MDLESKVAELQKEVSEGTSTRKTRSAADWIPRPPEKLVIATPTCYYYIDHCIVY